MFLITSIPLTAPEIAPDSHPAAKLAQHLNAILANTMALITAMFRRLGPRTLPAWTRFSRSRRRLVTLFNNLAEGKLTVGRAKSRHPAPTADTPTEPARKRGGAPAPYLPRGHAWLVRMIGHHAAGFGSQLQHLLNDPETQATLAAAPPPALAYAARTLRPLCRLLGVDLPPLLQAPPRPPRAKPPKPPRAPRPKLPPLLPLYPQRKPRPFPVLPSLIKKSSPA